MSPLQDLFDKENESGTHVTTGRHRHAFRFSVLKHHESTDSITEVTYSDDEEMSQPRTKSVRFKDRKRVHFHLTRRELGYFERRKCFYGPGESRKMLRDAERQATQFDVDSAAMTYDCNSHQDDARGLERLGRRGQLQVRDVYVDVVRAVLKEQDRKGSSEDSISEIYSNLCREWEEDAQKRAVLWTRNTTTITTCSVSRQQQQQRQ